MFKIITVAAMLSALPIASQADVVKSQCYLINSYNEAQSELYDMLYDNDTKNLYFKETTSPEVVKMTEFVCDEDMGYCFVSMGNYVFGQPNVTLVISGKNSNEVFDDNVVAVKDFYSYPTLKDALNRGYVVAKGQCKDFS